MSICETLPCSRLHGMSVGFSSQIFPTWFSLGVVGLLGLVIGSFVNVLIYRVPRGHSVVTTRSRCTNCRTQLGAADNIPVLSWILLGGKCRNCGKGITARYPLVELLNSLVFIAVAGVFGFTASLPIALVLSSALIALAFIDAEHMILPNRITYPLFLLLLFYRFVDSVFLKGDSSLLLDGLLGSLVGGGLLFGLGALWKILRGVEAMGLGDVKMMLAVGMFLGWDLVLLAIFLGALLGTIGGAIVIGRNSGNLQSRIPFGVFLAIGSLVSMLIGREMIGWYLDTFLR